MTPERQREIEEEERVRFEEQQIRLKARQKIFLYQSLSWKQVLLYLILALVVIGWLLSNSKR